MKYKEIYPIEKFMVWLYCVVICPFFMILGFFYGITQLKNPFGVAMGVYKVFVEVYNEVNNYEIMRPSDN